MVCSCFCCCSLKHDHQHKPQRYIQYSTRENFKLYVYRFMKHRERERKKTNLYTNNNKICVDDAG